MVGKQIKVPKLAKEGIEDEAKRLSRLTQTKVTEGEVVALAWLKYVSANADSTQDGYPSAKKGQYPLSDAENDKRSNLSYVPEDEEWFRLLAGILQAGGQWADFARKTLENIADQAGVKPDERSEYRRAQDLIDASEEALGIAPETPENSTGNKRVSARRRKALGE